ncbi:MAG: hypothetical protein AAFW46_02585 [Pseudomonadota bacterium]
MGLDDVNELDAVRADEPIDVYYDRFSPKVSEALGFYVYRLEDPRNGETFYVGRGVDNRVFAHMEEAEDGVRGAKTDRIREIHEAGQQVRAIIHRHGLRDQDEAAVLEAALIEAYPNLTNQVAGEGTRLYGARSADSAIRAYDLPPAQLSSEKCVLLSLTPSWPSDPEAEPQAWYALYTLARYAWRLDIDRAAKAKHIVIQARGIVRGVFLPERWLPADDPAFAGFPKPVDEDAWGFVGKPDTRAWRAWVGRRVPERYRTRFGQRVRYVNL